MRRRTNVLSCQECGATTASSWRGWRAYRTDDPEESEPPALAFYCPACADREFGVPPRKRRSE